MQYTEEGEMLMNHNPKGGRPMRTGAFAMKRGSDVDISEIREDSQIRYHLGYCQCSRAIKVGHLRAEMLVAALEKRGIEPPKRRFTLRERIAKRLLAKSQMFTVDNLLKS